MPSRQPETRAFRDIERALEDADPSASCLFTALDRQMDATWTGMSIMVIPGDGSPSTERKLRNLDRSGFDRVAQIRETARAKGLYLESPYGPDGDR